MTANEAFTEKSAFVTRTDLAAVFDGWLGACDRDFRLLILLYCQPGTLRE
ncbi:MAG TPA: hypothetical protein V6D50_09750 [Chroococcales cyanobacterium]|jgi:hypothetical protein